MGIRIRPVRLTGVGGLQQQVGCEQVVVSALSRYSGFGRFSSGSEKKARLTGILSPPLNQFRAKAPRNTSKPVRTLCMDCGLLDNS